MKKELEVKFDDLEWLYSPNWEYFDYGDCNFSSADRGY